MTGFLRPGCGALAGLALGLAWCAPAAAAAPFEGFEPGRPIESAATELLRLVRKNCPEGREVLTVGTASVPASEQAFTQDQGNHLMNAVHSALSRVSGVKMAPFRDIGAIMEVTGSGISTQEVEKQLGQIDIVVKAEGQKIRDNVKLTLTAIGRNGLECFERTPAFDVPPELAGEIYTLPDNIFQNAARDLWNKVKGHNDVAVLSRTATGESLDQQLPAYFERLMRSAVTKTQDPDYELRDKRIIVVPRGSASGAGRQRWATDVTVEPRKAGIKIWVEVTQPNETAIVAEGMISEADFPALQRVILRGAAVGRGGSELRLGDAPVRFQDRLEGRNSQQTYRFDVPRESYVEVDLPTVKGPKNAKLQLAVVGEPPVFVGSARPNLSRYRLPPGRYEAKVENPTGAKVEYEFRVRMASVEDRLIPEVLDSRLRGRFQDWYVGEVKAKPGAPRGCYAYTAATQVTPDDWREQAPVIWMSAYDLTGLAAADREERKGLTHKLDDLPRYAAGQALEASVEGLDGPRTLAVGGWNNMVVPSVTGADGEPTLDRDAIRGYTEGTTLELQGVTADGRPSRIVYSLQGYRSAVNAMSLACNRRDLANDLVWR